MILLSIEVDVHLLNISFLAACTPIVFDFFWDLFSESGKTKSGKFASTVLLLSLILPDAIIYWTVIPNGDAALLVCVFHTTERRSKTLNNNNSNIFQYCIILPRPLDRAKLTVQQTRQYLVRFSVRTTTQTATTLASTPPQRRLHNSTHQHNN